MKFSIAYVKEHPVMFGVIFVVFGLVLWLLLNKGAPSTATTVTSSTTTDAATLAAQTQIATANIAAQAQTQQGQLQLAALSQQGQNDLALGTLQAQVALAQNASDERTNSLGVEASLAALRAQLDSNQSITESNNQFQVNFAKVAYDSATENNRINAALQATLSQQQADAFKINTLASQIPNVNKNDRDNLLALLTGAATGAGVSYDGRDGPISTIPLISFATQPATINPSTFH